MCAVGADFAYSIMIADDSAWEFANQMAADDGLGFSESSSSSSLGSASKASPRGPVAECCQIFSDEEADVFCGLLASVSAAAPAVAASQSLLRSSPAAAHAAAFSPGAPAGGAAATNSLDLTQETESDSDEDRVAASVVAASLPSSHTRLSGSTRKREFDGAQSASPHQRAFTSISGDLLTGFARSSPLPPQHPRLVYCVSCKF